MDEYSQINSSPSILIPESPQSPILPGSSPPTIHNHQTWQENHDSETYTQRDDPQVESDILNINDVGGSNTETDNASANIDAPWHPSIISYNDNATISHNDVIAEPQSSQSNEDSNQSALTVPAVTTTLHVDPWRPGLSLFDDNSNSAQSRSPIISEDSRSTMITANEESNSSVAFPDPRDIKDDDEPPSKVRKLNSPTQSDDVDGETCPICLDTWGNSGEHRLVSLKCGHLFGAQCVERWLKGQYNKDRSCPTCKRRATLKDVRFIYARRLVAADTSQVTALQKQIDILQAEKNRADLELQKSRLANRVYLSQLEVLRMSLLKSQVTKEQPQRRSWRFALEKNLEVCKDGGCRVLTYNCRTYEMYVSQKSTNNLFPGFGIRKVSCVDYKLGQFVYLHSKSIRDITYSQPRDLLLSVGLDNTARIVERGIPSATIHCSVPLWSCSWDYLRSNEFYVGGVGGVIYQYDVRNPGTYIERLNSSWDLSPVVSLCSTEHGLLSCQLNSCRLWISNMRQWEPRVLPFDGPFMSLCYDNVSHRVLVTSRASGTERSKLSLCKLKPSVPSGQIVFDTEQTFTGSARSSLISRSTWVRTPGATWVAAHSESDSSLHLHGLDGVRTMSLPAAEPALDVCAGDVNGDTVLAALSDSRLRLYKAVPTNF